MGYDNSKAGGEDRKGEALRTAFIAASILALLLYGIVFASWAHAWQYSDAMSYMIGFPTGKDFINLYAAGQILAQSMELFTLFDSKSYADYLTKLFSRNVDQYHYVWSYPPSMLLPARLFAGLPYLPAFALWSAATLAIYLGGLHLAGLRGWWLAAALLAPGAAVNLFFGQFGFLLAGLLIGGLSQAGRRPVLAGIMMGLATVKPQMGLLLPLLLLANRQWLAMAWAAGTAAFLLALSMAVDGLEAWRLYFDLTLPVQRMFLEEGRGFYMLLTAAPFMAAKIYGLPVALLYVLQAAIALLCAVVVYRMGRRATPPAALAFTLVCAFLATPYAMAYDLVILAGAGLLLLAAQPGYLDKTSRAVVFAMIWTLPLAAASGKMEIVGLVPVVIALFAWQLWHYAHQCSDYSDAMRKSKSAP